MNDRESSTRNSSSFALRALKTGLALGGLTVGALAAANAVIAANTPQLSPRLGGQFGRYPARFGDIAYIVAGTGSPVLLLHGLDAGRSMAEWRGVFEMLADHHTVYAFDWLGWGLSDPARDGYSAADFAEQARMFIRDVIGGPTAVAAAGQGGIFATLAAREGAAISSLALVCPVPPAYDAPSGQSRAEALLQGAFFRSLLAAPVFGTSIVNWLRSQNELTRWARNQGFFDKERAGAEVKTLYVTAHQDAAGRGQRAFLSGDFDADWRQAWSALEIPALLIWGRNALHQGFESAPEWLALQPAARLEVLENALLLPHLEAPQRFGEIVLPWLDAGDASAA